MEVGFQYPSEPRKECRVAVVRVVIRTLTAPCLKQVPGKYYLLKSLPTTIQYLQDRRLRQDQSSATGVDGQDSSLMS